MLGLDKRKWITTIFRGSNNTLNWIVDFEAILVDYERPWCSGAQVCSSTTAVLSTQVHFGFYQAYRHHMDSVVTEIKRLHQLHPDYKVVLYNAAVNIDNNYRS